MPKMSFKELAARAAEIDARRMEQIERQKEIINRLLKSNAYMKECLLQMAHMDDPDAIVRRSTKVLEQVDRMEERDDGADATHDAGG